MRENGRVSPPSGSRARRIYLLRHAKSSWDDPDLPDHERPLAPRGRKAAARLAAHLAGLGVVPDLVLCSPARRTRETLERLGPAVAGAPVELEEGLYLASAPALLERLRAVPEDRASVLLIGHNPGIHEAALALAGRGDRARLEQGFPTGALATLEYEGEFAELAPGSCALVDFVVPRELPDPPGR